MFPPNQIAQLKLNLNNLRCRQTDDNKQGFLRTSSLVLMDQRRIYRVTTGDETVQPTF